MSWTFTIEFILPPRGAADWSQDIVGTWRVGTPVAVYPFRGIPDVVTMPRTGLVHVYDVPDHITLEKVRSHLTAPWESDQPDEDGRPSRIERRIWKARHDLMSGPGKAKLLADRQVSTNWTRLKQISHHLKENRTALDADFS